MSTSCRRCLLLIAFVFPFHLSWSQSSPHPILSLEIVDEADQSPIRHAVIAVASTETFTNFKGRAQTAVQLPPGSEITISALGYEKRVIPVREVEDGPADEIRLGQIEMKRISAGSLFRERVHYPKIEEDSSRLTLLDVLRTLPGIEWGVTGGMSVDGYYNIRFIIQDDIIDPDSPGSRGLLQQIAGKSIKSIRIFTPADYTARSASLGGIIKLQLKRTEAQWLTSLEMQHRGSDRYHAGIGLHYRAKKFVLETAFRNRAGTYEGYGSLRRWRQEDHGHNTLQQHYRQLQYSERPEWYSRLVFRPNPRTSIELEGDWLHYQGQKKNTFDTDFMDEVSGTSHFLQQRVIDLTHEEQAGTAAARFNKSFSSAEHKLSVSLDYRKMDEDKLYRFQNADFDMDGFTLLEILELTRNQIRGERDGLKFGLEYTQPFRETGALSFGWRTREESWQYSFTHFNFDYAGDAFFEVPPLHNRFLYRKQYHQVYSNLFAHFNPLTLLVKMEAEQFFTDVTTKIVDPAFERDLFYLLPHIRAEYALTHHSMVLAEYRRSLDKPTDRELNPFIDFTNLFYLSTGDPLLLPELKNSFALGYEKRWERHLLRGRLYHEQTTDRIMPVLGIAPGNIALNRFENIDLSADTGAELFLKSQLGKAFKASLQFSVFQNRLKSDGDDSGLNADLWSFRTEWNLDAKIGKDFSAVWQGMYHGETNLPQGVLEPYLASTLHFKLKLLESRLELNFGTNDLFNSSGRRLKTTTGGYEQVYDHRDIRRVLYVGTRFDFGASQLRRYSVPAHWDP